MDSNYDKHFKDVKPTSFSSDKKEDKISINELIDFFKDGNFENYQEFNNGLVYQKNKDIKLVEQFFKLLIEEADKIQSKAKNTDDNILFKNNKKILITNLNFIRETFNQYGINESRMLYFLLGTFIQYIYEQRKY
jgi:hypothetical protein|tara:strand:+ start:382 stop:786 length:405 start_codon:yes stop_codon:yes gene_type:complete